MSTQVRMNCLKAENNLQLFLLPLSFIYIKGRLHLNGIVLKIELSC